MKIPCYIAALTIASVNVMAASESTKRVPAPEHFEPTWSSLSSYECPEWFRDAKFGIWAHWGPQSVPMVGDWFARKMYQPDGPGDHFDYEYHLKNYGHPSTAGYKDIIPLWKAEKFDPDRLMTLYKAAGAHYFVSMGVHHDNFDLWNSKYHSWNAVKMGPMRDIVGAWQVAAKKQGLRFGVSEHLGASYTWFQPAHESDQTGEMAGVPYDGANPKWQELYHPRAQPGDNAWYSTDPDWAREWAQRIGDLVDQYQPDLLYSDGALPFGEVGRTLLAHYYNENMAHHGGKLEAVYNLKDPRGRAGHGEYVEGIGVQDVERGGLAGINPQPWQTDTAIGDWFYNRNWKAKDTGTMYRSSKWVIHTLIDVVSKNGNLLLNVIQRPDGSIDLEVEKLLGELAAWMKVNGEAIFATRPWLIYGEGKTHTASGAFKEDYVFSSADIRFTQSKDSRTLYAMVLGWPADGKLRIRALGRTSDADNKIETIELLGLQTKVAFTQDPEGLLITLPAEPVSEIAFTLKLKGQNFRPLANAVAP